MWNTKQHRGIEAWPFVLWPPSAGPNGWGGIQNVSITPGGSARAENKNIHIFLKCVLISRGSKLIAPAASLASVWPEKEGLGIGSCLWPITDCVLPGFLLLFYFSNLMKGAILSWWESICIWTVGCSSSVTQGVPEEMRTARVHMAWKRTPRSSSDMCGSADRRCCFFQFWKVA